MGELLGCELTICLGCREWHVVSTVADMSTTEQRSNLVNFLQILADVFAKEPPVISRQQQQPHPQHDSTAGDQQSNSHFPSSFAQTAQSLPPPKPPKSAALAEPTSYSPLSPRASQKNALVDGLMEPPALPPKPGITSGKNHQNTDGTQYRRYASRQQNDAQRRGPPLPPLPPNISSPHARRPSYINGLQASQQWTMSQQKRPPSVMTGPTQVRPQQPVTIRPQQPQPAKSPQDLMSAPLEVTLPSQHDNRMIAPPIPPNPEKDALLRAISQALIAQLTRTTSQNYAAIPSLEAQNAAMQQAYRNLSDEVSQLQDLDKMLTSNEKILHETMREADKQLDSVGRKEKPKVDEVLVAPNIVGEQLYGLVADERAIGDTMFALTKALDKGRVGADVYVKVSDQEMVIPLPPQVQSIVLTPLKQTRSLAREQFLKKALIQKIGSGMGLDAT